MHDELQKKLIEWAETITSSAYEKLPAFAMEILNYNFFYNAFEALLLAVLCFCMGWLIKRVYQERIEKKDRYAFEGMEYIFFVLGLIFFIGACYDLVQCIKIYFAPSVFLLEYLAGLK